MENNSSPASKEKALQEQLKVQEDNTVSYSDKTHRLIAISNFIKSITPYVWAGVIVIIITGIWGQHELSKARSSVDNGREVTVSITSRNNVKISDDLSKAIGEALVAAKDNATRNVNQWKEDSKERVSHPFLDWYYNYFTQWSIGLKAIWTNISSFSSSDQEKAEKIIEGFQKEFEKQVFQPSLMQLQMERYTRDAVNVYVQKMEGKLKDIQGKYRVPQPEWERYLSDLGSVTYNSNGKSQDVNLALLSSAGKGYVAVTVMTTSIKAIGTTKIISGAASKATTKVIGKIATKSAAKIATEGAGELTAGLVGLELINPVAGVGILAWDIWDHYNTVKVERPILQKNLNQYLDEFGDSLLNDTESGILSAIYQYHYSVMDQLSQQKYL